MADRDEPTPQHVIDARTLTRTQLGKRYALTYSSWRNMKQRGKDEGATISPEFEDFVDFLIAVGPRPEEGYSIDRIDSSNPEYGPGLVRWLDKRGQANNRVTTIMLTVDGATKPLSLWAEETGQKADTLRSRLAKGWSPEEVVHGKASPREAYSDPWNYRPWPEEPVKYRHWEDLYQSLGKESQLPIDFFIDRLRLLSRPMEEYIANNYGYTERDDGLIPAMDEKCLEYIRKLEPLEARLNEALHKKHGIHDAVQRTPKPRGWCGPRRFNHKPD